MNKQHIQLRSICRVKNSDFDEIVEMYGSEIDVIEKEYAYTLVGLTEGQIQDLQAAEIFVVRY